MVIGVEALVRLATRGLEKFGDCHISGVTVGATSDALGYVTNGAIIGASIRGGGKKVGGVVKKKKDGIKEEIKDNATKRGRN